MRKFAIRITIQMSLMALVFGGDSRGANKKASGHYVATYHRTKTAQFMQLPLSSRWAYAGTLYGREGVFVELIRLLL